MDLWTGDFNQGLLCTTPSWENYIKAAGTEGASLCGTIPSTLCCLLASSASEGRTGTFFAASAPHVSLSFHSVTLWSIIRWLYLINLFLSFMLSRFEQADSEVLNYLLEFVNWSTLSPALKHILDRRREEKTWQPCPHFGTVTKYTVPVYFY